MPILEKLRNIFGNSGDSKKKVKEYPHIKRDCDPGELWEIVGELGDGAFGKVYKSQHKERHLEAALKQVDIKDEMELEEYSVEIDILSQCKHRNIVGMYEAYFFNNKLCMYIEFCGGGAVDSIMQELEKPLTEPQIRCICHEMCEALEFLHQHFVIHRDLKAGNVLLTADGQVRLADFGVSAKNTSARQRRDSFIGTPYWMAPEVILCETIKDCPYNYKADIWSFGITLIEFAEVDPPNHEMHPMRVFMKIQKSNPPTLNKPTKWSIEFNDFIAKCLVKDPEQRPTASDLRQHAFIRNVTDLHPLVALVSEANAEVVYEEKDIDEIDDQTSSDTESVMESDMDTVSVTSEFVNNKGLGADLVPPKAEELPRRMAHVSNGEKQSMDSLVESPSGSSISADIPSIVVADDNEAAKDVEVILVPTIPPPVAKSDDVKLSGEESKLPEPILTISVATPEPEKSEMAKEDTTAEESKQSPPVTEDLMTFPVSPAETESESVGDKFSPPAQETSPVVEAEEESKPSVPTLEDRETPEPTADLATETVSEPKPQPEEITVSTPDDSVKPAEPNAVSDIPLPASEPTVTLPETVPAEDVKLMELEEDKIAELEGGVHIPEVPPCLEDIPTETTTAIENADRNNADICEPADMSWEAGSPTKLISADGDDVGRGEEPVAAAAVPSGEQAATKPETETMERHSSEISGAGEQIPEKGSSEVEPSMELIAKEHKADEKPAATEVESMEPVVTEQEAHQKPATEKAEAARSVEDLHRCEEEKAANDKDQQAGVAIVDKFSVTTVLEPTACSADEAGETLKAAEDQPVALVPAAVDVTTVSDKNEHEASTVQINAPVVTDASKVDKNDVVVDKNVVKAVGDAVIINSTAHKSSEPAINVGFAVPDVPKEVVPPSGDHLAKPKSQLYEKKKDSVAAHIDGDIDGAMLSVKSANAPGATVGEETVVLRNKANRSPALGKSQQDEAAAEKAPTARQQRNKTRKTLTKTRKFVVNGIEMTSQTSRIVGAEELKKQHEHELWKADLRELKRLHVQENRLLQCASAKAVMARDEQNKKFEFDMQTLLRANDAEIDSLMRQNRQAQDKLATSQLAECKALQKKVKLDQDRDLKLFRDSLKQDLKLMRQSIDMLPKEMRKDALRQRKEEKEAEQVEKERHFQEKQAEEMEKAMKRLSEQHREKVALCEKQFIQQTQQAKRVHLTAILDLEQRHINERKQLEEHLLKDTFILKRQLMMTRQAKELEQIKRVNAQKEQELQQRHLLERKRLPKIIKSDTKTRQLMFRESLRISSVGINLDTERERIKKFDEAEKQREKQETLRLEQKQRNQMDQLRAKNEAIIKELDQVYIEKQSMLVENEKQKISELESKFQHDLEEWKNMVEPRNQGLEDEFMAEIEAFEKFYSTGDAACPPYPAIGRLTGEFGGGKFGFGVRGSMAM